MRRVKRSAFVAFVVALGTMVFGVFVAVTSSIALAATVLIVPGTGTPNPETPQDYENNAIGYYVLPNPTDTQTCADTTCVGVPYIAQFWPFPFPGWGGLEGAKWDVSVASGVGELNRQYGMAQQSTGPNGEIVIFGYSQGATVVSTVKGQLQDSAGGVPSNTEFVVIGNPNRPNGGLFERLAFLGTLPILDATFGNPTPTDTSTVINTTDTALQYDAVSDAPTFPINGLAMLNALAGFEYVHGTYLAPDDGEGPGVTPYGYTPAEIVAIEAAAKADGGCTAANYCTTHGDTRYITLPAKKLPIFQPFADLAASTGTTALVAPVIALIQPVTQTLIETGYDRSDYGKPTPFQLVPRFNPFQVTRDLIADVPEGIEDAITVANGGQADLSTPNGPQQTVTADTTLNANKAVTPSTKSIAEKTGPTSTRTSLFASPKGIVKQIGAVQDRQNGVTSDATRPRPIRDAVKAASDTVKKVVKRINDAAKKAGDTAKSGSTPAA